MTSSVEHTGNLQEETFKIEVRAPDWVKLSGTLAMRRPSDAIQLHLRALHQAALRDKLKRLTVDVTDLTFVNSSAIRLFIDWSTWLEGVAQEKRYLLCFLTDSKISWQRSSFEALKSLSDGVLEIRPK